MTDTCVSCGTPVPEGRMVCPSCAASDQTGTGQETPARFLGEDRRETERAVPGRELERLFRLTGRKKQDVLK